MKVVAEIKYLGVELIIIWNFPLTLIMFVRNLQAKLMF